MYPDPAEQAKKLALFGMAGALANTIALVLAGVFLLASWRWYFRFIVSPPIVIINNSYNADLPSRPSSSRPLPLPPGSSCPERQPLLKTCPVPKSGSEWTLAVLPSSLPLSFCTSGSRSLV